MSNVIKIDSAFIDTVIKEYNKYGSLLNKVLYDLCEENFEHNSPNAIIAKTQLIGRTYAVALERQRDKEQINDDFYLVTVVNAFKNSQLDTKLQSLKTETELTLPVLIKTLQIHKYLVDELSKITRNSKKGNKRSTRSFCSKYLHFHLPNLFFIYDSRAKDALSALNKHYQIKTKNNPIKNDTAVDIEYATFAYKCFYLLNKINEHINTPLTMRQLDNLFLKVANDKLKTRKIPVKV